MKIATVLKSGGDFSPDHVRALRDQLPELVCFSDLKIDGVETIPLKRNWPGWWSKLELFDPSTPGDILFFDLDTVILGPVTDMVFDRSMCLSDLRRPYRMATGILYIKEKDKQPIFEHFLKNTAPMKKREWDVVALEPHGERFGRLQDALPGKISSYKADVLAGKPLTDIVCFHGKPRPWEVNEEWLPNYGNYGRQPC